MGSYFHTVAHSSKRVCDYLHDKEKNLSPVGRDFIGYVTDYFCREIDILKKIGHDGIDFEKVPKTRDLAQLLINTNEKGDLDESQVGFIIDKYSHIVENLDCLREGGERKGIIYTTEEDFNKTYEFMKKARDFFSKEFAEETL